MYTSVLWWITGGGCDDDDNYLSCPRLLQTYVCSL